MFQATLMSQTARSTNQLFKNTIASKIRNLKIARFQLLLDLTGFLETQRHALRLRLNRLPNRVDNLTSSGFIKSCRNTKS